MSNYSLAKGSVWTPRIKLPKSEHICPGCGKTIEDRSKECARCAVGTATKQMRDAARIGRLTANGPEAQKKKGNQRALKCVGSVFLEGIGPANVAHPGSLHQKDSTASGQRSDVGYSIGYRRVELVCQQDSKGLYTSCAPLTNAGRVGRIHRG